MKLLVALAVTVTAAFVVATSPAWVVSIAAMLSIYLFFQYAHQTERRRRARSANFVIDPPAERTWSDR